MKWPVEKKATTTTFLKGRSNFSSFFKDALDAFILSHFLCKANLSFKGHFIRSFLNAFSLEYGDAQRAKILFFVPIFLMAK